MTVPTGTRRPAEEYAARQCTRYVATSQPLRMSDVSWGDR